jgi:ATP-dependent exoDNAse (exonuclease V) beta subunit
MKQKDGKPTVGFIKDHRRANVALTRAKRALWIVGNKQVLKSSCLWSRLVEQLEDYQVVSPVGDFRSMLAQWKASQE